MTFTVNLVPHFLIFLYYLAIIKIYAFFTFHGVGWETRADVGIYLAVDIGKEEIEMEKNDLLLHVKEMGVNGHLPPRLCTPEKQ